MGNFLAALLGLFLYQEPPVQVPETAPHRVTTRFCFTVPSWLSMKCENMCQFSSGQPFVASYLNDTWFAARYEPQSEAFYRFSRPFRMLSAVLKYQFRLSLPIRMLPDEISILDAKLPVKLGACSQAFVLTAFVPDQKKGRDQKGSGIRTNFTRLSHLKHCMVHNLLRDLTDAAANILWCWAIPLSGVLFDSQCSCLSAPAVICRSRKFILPKSSSSTLWPTGVVHGGHGFGASSVCLLPGNQYSAVPSHADQSLVSHGAPRFQTRVFSQLNQFTWKCQLSCSICRTYLRLPDSLRRGCVG